MEWSYLIIFVVGFFVAILNVVAGAGSLITLPTLIFLGLSPTVANATNRLGVFLQASTATAAYYQQGQTNLRKSLQFGIWTLPGAVLGAYFAVKIPEVWMQRTIAIVLVLGVLGFFIKPNPQQTHSVSTKPSWYFYLMMFFLGAYAGFIQASAGIVLILIFHRLLGFDLIKTNIHKSTIICLLCIPVLMVFVFSGKINWPMGIALAVGNMVGAIVGTKLSLHGGEKVIRPMLGIALLLMAYQLFIGL